MASLSLLNDPDIRHGVSLFERRQRADEHDRPGLRRRHVLKRAVQVVGDEANLRAFRDVRVAIDRGMEDAFAVRSDVDDLLDPDRMRHRLHGSRQHLEVPHHAHGAVHERGDVARRDRSRATGFGGERRLAARRRRVLEKARRLRILRPVGDDDVVEAEREHHRLREVVLLLIAGHRPVAVRPQVLVEIAAVEIDQVVALLDDFSGDHERRAIALRAVRVAGIAAVHALVVRRVHVRRELLERRHVDHRHEDQRARQVRRVHGVNQRFDGENRRVLGAVRARDDGEDRPGPGAVEDGDRNIVASVRAGRHPHDAVGLLAPRGFRRADRERRVRVLRKKRVVSDLSRAHQDRQGQERRCCECLHAANFTTFSATAYSCCLPPVKTSQLYINGEFVAPGASATVDVIDPSTTDVIARVPDANAADVDRAVRAARAAFDDGPWKDATAQDRGRVLFKLAEIVRSRADELAEIETRNTGNPIVEAEFDMADVATCFEYYGGLATKIHGDVIPVPDNAMSLALREPIGVAGQIVPWNYPLLMAAWKLAPAICAGCTAVLKPAEQTPLSILALAYSFADAGLPAGVVNIVTGVGERTGSALVEHADVDKIAFTGSAEVGRIIMRGAAGTLKKISLELGGKSPNIFFADSDFEAAVDGALFGVFINQGEVCSAGSRILVQRPIYKQFVEAMAAKTKAITLGPG